MRKSNPKAAVICITFVIIALAAGIFIGYMMGQNSQPPQQGETVLSTEDPSSSAASDSDSDTQAASDSESSESESQTQGTENQEVVVTVGDRTVGMDEVNYRLYSLRNYYIQAYGEEPWNETTEDGETVAEAAKAQLDDDIVRTEILCDKAADYGIEANSDIQEACRTDAQELIDGLGEDICAEFGLTESAVESVFLKREISTQVITAINDEVREELLQDPENESLSDADLEVKISEGYEERYQEMKAEYDITYSDIWDNIVVGSVG